MTSSLQAPTRAEPVRAHEHELFIVYAGADAAFVRGYLLPAVNLAAESALLVDELTPGAPLVSEIARGVERSRFTVVVLSPDYLRDRWAALGEQLASHASLDATRIIPVLLRECELPIQLAFRVALDFRERDDWENEVGRLRALLATTPAAVEVVPCPFPGMRSFARGEAGVFFGREAEVRELGARLSVGERELYVIGPSGSGKSSLVEAGLLPALESGQLQLGYPVLALSVRPGEHPCARLAKLLETVPEAPELGALLAARPGARLLLFIDQLEEVFTVASVAERRGFAEFVRALRADVRCAVIFALRADFYGMLMESELWSALEGKLSRLDVAPVRGAALQRAIVEPARSVDVHIEIRLCDKLLADAADAPGVLPLLQETLRLLWNTRRQRLLELADYEALGDASRSGLAVALARRADATLRSLSSRQQAIARRILLRLVSFGEGRADTRRQLDADSLASTADSKAELELVLGALIADRLVTTSGATEAAEVLVDLSHESLIASWPSFSEWIAVRRADEQLRRRLEAKAEEWGQRGKGSASLLDAINVAEAEAWIGSDSARELGYGAELEALIAASRAALERAERQRRRRAGGVLAALVVIAAVVSALGIYAQRRAAAAEAQLALNFKERGRQLLFEGYPFRSLPYLVAAREKGIDDAPLRVLFAQASRLMPPMALPQDGVTDATFSPDGRSVLTASTDGSCRIWDAETGALQRSFEHGSGVNTVHVHFSPDGSLVLAAGPQVARVWEVATSRPRGVALQAQSFFHDAVFTADGGRVVTVDESGVRSWDVRTGESLSFIPVTVGYARELAALSADGSRFVASDEYYSRVFDAFTGKAISARFKAGANCREHGHFSAENRLFAFIQAQGWGPRGAVGPLRLEVWDAAASPDRPVVDISPRTHEFVTNVTFTPDGTQLVVYGADTTARFLGSTNGQATGPVLEHPGELTMVAFDAAGDRVATAGGHVARVWDPKTGTPLSPWLEHPSVISKVALAADGRRVVTWEPQRHANLWRLDTNPEVALNVTGRADFQESMSAIPAEEMQYIRAAFSADGESVATFRWKDSIWEARTWNLKTRLEQSLLIAGNVAPHMRHQVLGAQLSSRGDRLVVALSDGSARVWDLARNVAVSLGNSTGAASFSPGGDRIVTTEDGVPYIWNVNGQVLWPSTAEERSKLEAEDREHAGFVGNKEYHSQLREASFSADGKRLAVGDGIRDAMTGRWLVSFASTKTTAARGFETVKKTLPVSATFSPDGKSVVTFSIDTAQIWDATSGKPRGAALAPGHPIHGVGFSSDGKLVATGQCAGVSVWSAETGRLAIPLLAYDNLDHDNDNCHFADTSFSPDGSRILGSTNFAVQVWDAATGQQLVPPEGRRAIDTRAQSYGPVGGGVNCTAFSADGNHLFIGTSAMMARVLDVSPDSRRLAEWKSVADCSLWSLAPSGHLAPSSNAAACAAVAKPKPHPTNMNEGPRTTNVNH